MPNAVVLDHVTKSYAGRTALENVSLAIPAGTIFGLVGPNGSGKTTLLKLMAGLARPSLGRVLVEGQVLGLRPATSLGAMIENPGLYPELSGHDNLRLQARLQRISHIRLEDCLAEVGLDPANRRPVRTYSLGMKQRLGVALALLHEPRILLLDEPTNGLDPTGIIQFRIHVVELAKNRGMTVLVASHILHELERLVSHVAFLHEGRIRRAFPLERPIQRALRIETADPEGVAARLQACGAKLQRGDGHLDVFCGEVENPGILAHLKEGMASVRAFYPLMPSLEDLYREAMWGGQHV